jgi:hypothetical protein
MRNNAMLLFHSRAILRAGINRIRKLAGAEPLPEQGFSVRGELKQAGQIVVIFALMLVVLIGLVGIAVDTTYAWRESLRVQRAADAASLAGVVSMPGDFATATTTADSAAARNGYTSSSITTIAVTKANNPDELDVSITTQVPTFFSRIFGINSFTVTRSSKAVYILPVPMGSPENYYGTFGSYKVNGSPVALKGPGGETLNARGFWGSMLTMGAGFINGDAYMPKGNNTDGSGTNPQHDTADYYDYGVYMPPGSTNGHVYIFDPGFCATDGAQGTGERWLGGSNAVSSYYKLYNTNNQPYNLAAQTLLGTSGNLFANEAYSDSAEGGSGGSSCTAGKITDPNNGEYYHDKWWELTGPQGANVTLSGGAGGTTYRVRTTTDPGDSSQDSTNATNDFAIFASDTGTAPQVYGLGAMEMYTPLPGGTNSTFYLAQISQQAGAGKTIQINLWDPGDTNQTADLYILQPTASGWSPVNLTWTCQKLATAGTNCSGGSGAYVETSTGSTSHFNGCWLYISIPVPTSYTAPQSGWWKIEYAMGGSTNSTDETTWQVNIKGNPVHLIG